MAGTKANWHVAPVLSGADEEPDPFSMPIEEVGQRVDLRDPQAGLELRLAELLSREERLFNRGITCAIKDRADTTCHACPVSQAHQRHEPLGVLCRIGRDQEIALTELAVLRCQGQ